MLTHHAVAHRPAKTLLAAAAKWAATFLPGSVLRVKYLPGPALTAQLHGWLERVDLSLAGVEVVCTQLQRSQQQQLQEAQHWEIMEEEEDVEMEGGAGVVHGQRQQCSHCTEIVAEGDTGAHLLYGCDAAPPLRVAGVGPALPLSSKLVTPVLSALVLEEAVMQVINGAGFPGLVGYWEARMACGFADADAGLHTDPLTVADVYDLLAKEEVLKRGYLVVRNPNHQLANQQLQDFLMSDQDVLTGPLVHLAWGEAWHLGQSDCEVHSIPPKQFMQAVRLQTACFDRIETAFQRKLGPRGEPWCEQHSLALMEAVLRQVVQVALPFTSLSAPHVSMGTFHLPSAIRGGAEVARVPTVLPGVSDMDLAPPAARKQPAWVCQALSNGDEGFGGTAMPLLGLSVAVGQLCGPGSADLASVQDMLLASATTLVWGAPRVWWIVTGQRGRGRDPLLTAAKRFTTFARTATGESAAHVFSKELFPNLTKEDMEALGVERVLQHPGDVVIFPPGATLAWTMSMGPSFSESVNFFVPVQGVRTLEEGLHAHLRLLEEAGASSSWLDKIRGMEDDAKAADDERGRALV